MKKIKIIAGTIWAVSGLILILILFPGINSFSVSASKLPFMKINPNLTGGEVAKQISMKDYTIDIRKPVFDGLIKERKNGFVQIDWRGNIPDMIADTIDYDLDNMHDFRVMIDRKQTVTEIKSFNNKVGDVIASTATSYGWAMRINVKK
jgi:hypothetical protein